MKVGVLLSGCGVQDGSEVYEAVLTILAIERAGEEAVAIAPDIPQVEVIDHYRGMELRDGEPGGPTRSVLAESARIVRGKIVSATEVSSHDIDALIIPGGFGVTNNLCNYATQGANATVNSEVKKLIVEMNALGKPIGALCIAPVLVALCLGDKSPAFTIGNDAKTAVDLQRFGASHHESGVTDIYTDEANHIVSTPAFMLAKTAAEVEPGISKLVNKVIEIAKAL